MKKKAILYMGGGVMLGVYGAGFVSKLEKENAYEKIEAIYGSSAGVMNAAYFLSHQARLGSSIYTEDLVDNFLFPANLPIGTAQRLWNRYVFQIPREKMKNVVNIDYVLDIIKNKKPLNIKRISKSKIKFFIELLNLKTGEIDRKKFNIKNAFDLFRAAITVVPYYFRAKRINNHLYVDASIKQVIDFKYLLKKYPEHKIIFVLNVKTKRGRRHYVKNILEGVVADSMYKSSLYEIYKEREDLLHQDLMELKKYDRVLLIHPPRDIPAKPQTVDKKKLQRTFNMGFSDAKKFLKFVK